ncbi:MAG: oligosaccharide repeat unit polymerase [Flavobacteriaceae bacterium]
MINFSKHIPFFSSLFFGIFTWLVIFFIFPASIVNPFSREAFIYIVGSYTTLILGYLLVSPLISKRKKPEWKIKKKEVNILIYITLLSFAVRYIDLFLYRNVSFFNDVWTNRDLLNLTKPGFIFIFFSICKQLYFVPIILLFKAKIQDKKLHIISIILFLLPFIEGFIRGSRNSFFIPIILLLVIHIYFRKIRFNKKQLFIFGAVVTLLFVIATSIIIGREKTRTDENYTSITTGFLLNDFLKPYPWVFEKIHDTKNKTAKELMISGFQVGQYYVHGVFEFDFLMKHYQKEPLRPQYGKYTFATVNKFTNKCGFTNTNLEKVQENHPRGYTFITFFGGLYLDFGWVGLLIMFFYGAGQRVIYEAVKKCKVEYIPLFIFLLFANFFMLTFNFIENTGTYFIAVCSALIILIRLKDFVLSKK